MQRLRGMKINEMLKAIDNIEKRLFNLSDVQKILLTTDGSVTRMLEVLTKKPVMIKTSTKAPIEADEDLAKALKIKSGDVVNYRVVNLKNPKSDRALIFARSWTSIMRLSEKIKIDLTSADIPIGKILIKHKLETRREITSIHTVNADDEIAEAFNVKTGDLMLSRYYDIIHEARILIRINEVFPVSSFR
jgi:beta-ribofuranosylaminobenzene 5'-phosphate synthase